MAILSQRIMVLLEAKKFKLIIKIFLNFMDYGFESVSIIFQLGFLEFKSVFFLFRNLNSETSCLIVTDLVVIGLNDMVQSGNIT